MACSAKSDFGPLDAMQGYHLGWYDRELQALETPAQAALAPGLSGIARVGL